MMKRIWAFIVIFAVGSILFFSYQNFLASDKKTAADRNPTAQHDFNEIIDEGLESQKQLAKELGKVHPPERIGKEGLIKREQAMKRERIEGTSESIAAQESQEFFRDSRAKQLDERKNRKRLSQELEENP